MSIFSSYKKMFLLGFIIVILVAIPISVYIAEQHQQITSKASASTTLSFLPSSSTATTGGELTLDVLLDPGTADPKTANQVSFVKLVIKFDESKLQAEDLAPSKDPSNKLTSVLEDPIYNKPGSPGSASISLSIGADPTQVITTKTKIATLKFKALSLTAAGNPTSIIFDSGTQILSIAPSDQTSENVFNQLSTTTPATVTITSGSSGSPSAPAPTSAPGIPTPTSQAGIPTATQAIAGGGQSIAITQTPTPAIIQPTPTTIVLSPQTPLPPTGPGDKILGVGIIGAIFTLIGGALFIFL